MNEFAKPLYSVIRKISINKMMFEQFLKEEIFIGYCKHITGIYTGSEYNI